MEFTQPVGREGERGREREGERRERAESKVGSTCKYREVQVRVHVTGEREEGRRGVRAKHLATCMMKRLRNIFREL